MKLETSDIIPKLKCFMPSCDSYEFADDPDEDMSMEVLCGRVTSMWHVECPRCGYKSLHDDEKSEAVSNHYLIQSLVERSSGVLRGD